MDVLNPLRFARPKLGSTRESSSFGSRGTFRAIVNASELGAPVWGYARSTELWVNAGATVAVVMVMFTGDISETASKVADPVYPLPYGLRAVALVVSPVAIVILHSWYALRVAVWGDRIKTAVGVPV